MITILSITNREMRNLYGWSPGEHQSGQRDQIPGQRMLPGMPRDLPKKGVDYRSKEWNNPDDPRVWGSLVGQHNPFHHHSLEHEPSDMHNGWNEHDGWDDHQNEIEAHKTLNHLQSEVNDSHPCIRVRGHVLHSILDDPHGRVKSQFETNDSGGVLDHDQRGRYEETAFGYPHRESWELGEHDEKHPDHARPIYGYLAHDPVRNTLASQYGEHTLVLHKPSVWHRTTVTAGDSLGHQTHMRPSPVQKVGLHSYSAWPDMHGDTMAFRYHEDTATARRGTGMITAENNLHDKLTFHQKHDVDEPHGPLGYTEAQFHGGVDKRNIHYVVLRGHAPQTDLKQKLDEHGIPWIHKHSDISHDSRISDRSKRRTASFVSAVRYQEMLVRAASGAAMAPKVIATQGDGVYLIKNDDGTGQVADTRPGFGTIHPPQSVASIAARGYWHEIAPGSVDAEDVLRLVRPA